MNISKYVLYAATLAAVSIPVPLPAQSCDTFLGGLQTWLATPPSSVLRMLNVTMVSNRADGTSASYSEGSGGSPGTLSYYAGPSYAIPQVRYLQGDVVQYFSNRRFYTLPAPAPGETDLNYTAWAPFNPETQWFGDPGNSGGPDRLQININLASNFVSPILGGPTPPPFGQVTLTFLSQPHESPVSFTPSCQNGLVYGFAGNAAYVISLNETQIDTPPPPK